MATKCEINFDDPNEIYYSGESLNGFIKLITHAPKTIRGIHIKINGYGKVEVNRGRQVDTAFQKYLDSCTYVVGRKNGASFEYAPGIYDYTFYCKLPSTLPTSIYGIYGEIVYEVILTIERPLRFDDVFKREFTVISKLNPNNFPLYRQPKNNIEETEIFAHWCFSKPGIIKIKLSIPVGAYALGEEINFTLQVVNDSQKDLEQCKVKLIQRVTFETKEPLRCIYQDMTTLDSKCFSQVLSKSKKKFEDGILIPLVLPSTIPETFPIIRINYILRAIITTGLFHLNISCEVPIIIGTIPLTISTSDLTESSPALPNC